MQATSRASVACLNHRLKSCIKETLKGLNSKPRGAIDGLYVGSGMCIFMLHKTRVTFICSTTSPRGITDGCYVGPAISVFIPH